MSAICQHKVFVVVVTYNGMKWYERCFDSIMNSTIELYTVVIDNRSSDDSRAFIRNRYPSFHLIESSENLGFGKANNLGISYALQNGADYVFLLNQDAWVRPDTIEKLCAEMSVNRRFGVLSPMHLALEENRLDFKFSQYITAEKCPNFLSDIFLCRPEISKPYPIFFVNAAMWLLSKECILKVGGFSPLFPHYGEDNNYLYRVKYHKLEVGIFPQAIGVHGRDQVDISFSSLRFKKRLKQHYINYLKFLTQIEKSILRCFVESMQYTIAITIKSLLSADIKTPVSCLMASFKVLANIRQVSKTRSATKLSGPSYLETRL